LLSKEALQEGVTRSKEQAKKLADSIGAIVKATLLNLQNSLNFQTIRILLLKEVA
jgi:hypothetical protein